MRTDLPSMGAGRAAAQASHAANAFIHEHGNRDDVKAWQAQTPQGFGTAIVLGVTALNIDVLFDLEHGNEEVAKGKVYDPDYVITVPSEVVPYIDDRKLNQFEVSPTDSSKYLFHRKEMTCAYIFGDKEKLKPLLSQFPLYS